MPHRILVVEDSPTQAATVRSLLERNGYEVALARSAEEAIERLDAGLEVSLVLSDVVMPGADGYALARHIKERSGRTDVMVVLLTTLASPLDIVRGLAAGADNYVTKPFNPDVLLTRVRQTLRARERRREGTKANLGVQLEFLGTTFTITSDREHILDLMLASVEDTVRANNALQESQRRLSEAHEQLRHYADTQRHHAQVSSGRYEALMREANAAIFVLAADGRILETNPAAARLVPDPGRTSGELPVQLTDCVAPPDRPRVSQALAEVRRGAGVTVRSLPFTDNATAVYCDVALAVTTGESENVILAVANDITERRRAEQTVRDSEARYRALFEQNPAPLFVYDAQSLQILTVNEAAVRHYGYSPAEFRAMLISGLQAAGEPGGLSGGAGRAPIDGYTDAVHQRKDGSSIDVRLARHPIVVGGRDAHLVLVDDVTEERRTRSLLEARARQQEVLAELGQRALGGTTPAALIDEAIAAIASTLGSSLVRVVEMSGEGWKTVGRTAVAAAASEATQRDDYAIERLAMMQGEPLVIDDVMTERRVPPAAELVEAGLTCGLCVPVPGPFGPYGAVSAFNGAHRPFGIDDVHFLRGVAATIGATMERVRAARTLHATEERAHMVLNTLSEGVVTLHAHGEMRWCNLAASELLGVDPVAIRHQHVSDLGLAMVDEAGESFDLAAYVRDAGRRADRNGAKLVRVEIAPRPARWVLVSAVTLTQPEQPLDDLIAVTVVDFTQRKRVEEQLLQSQRLEAVGRLAGGVAHDFNNILTVMRAYTDLALKELDPASRVFADVEEISAATARATALTKQLLAFGRRSMTIVQPLSVNDVISGMESMLRTLVGDDAQLAVVLAPGIGPVLADGGQIEQVVMNLVANAHDAMPTGGTIIVETRDARLSASDADAIGGGLNAGTYAVISVSDTGMGMPADVRDRVFEPFFTTKGPGKGTGLGLATVYGIVKECDGHIALYSEVGHGTTFKIYLPITDADEGAPVDAIPPTLVGGSGETILLVEDDAAVRRVAGQELRRLDYHVLEAADGAEALAMLDHGGDAPQMVVTDMIMPGMNGREMTAVIRRSNPAIRVLYTSGYSGEMISRKAPLDPGDLFLEKPYTLTDLARLVRHALDELAPPGANSAGGDPR